MQSVTRLTLLLCAAWAASLLYGEMAAYWVPRFTCSWPRLPNVQHKKIAIVADPQIMDRTSLNLAPKSFAFETAQFYTDIYMRRAFQSSILPFDPDMIIFLGDQFDGGPYLSDDEWQGSLIRFKHIFGLGYGRSSDIPIHYLSGNHDIGYAAYLTQHPEVITRYEHEFGSRNFQISTGKVDFVIVDAQTLDGPKQGNETLASWDFVKSIATAAAPNPKVLLTHIPLYRPDNTPCGPHRSSAIINQRIAHTSFDQGIIYQNYLSKESSELLLSMIRPTLVLSGHDHDQCTVVHSTPFGSVTEHTLGTVSWQQGNLYPSFMLLSVASGPSSNFTSTEQVVSTNLCFLPMQTHIYIWYLFLFVATMVLLIFWPTQGLSPDGYVARSLGFIASWGRDIFSRSKEKNDEDCEYEMVWDSEGNMHLVKKTTVKVVNPNSERATGRGNVVARPSARKHQLEPDPSVYVEMHSEGSTDDITKLARTSKSHVRRVIQRLFRVIRMAVVIAAVNGPIYMMLLFKDWLDR